MSVRKNIGQGIKILSPLANLIVPSGSIAANMIGDVIMGPDNPPTQNQGGVLTDAKSPSAADINATLYNIPSPSPSAADINATLYNIPQKGQSNSSDVPSGYNVKLGFDNYKKNQGIGTGIWGQRNPLQSGMTLRGSAGNEQTASNTINPNADLEQAGRNMRALNVIGGGIAIGGAVAGLVNEFNKKPSTMQQVPQLRTPQLDADQSAFMDSQSREVEKNRAGIGRMLTDAGIDPLFAHSKLQTGVDDAMLKARSVAEGQRQQILGTQAGIDTNIQSTGAQLKANIDAMNIQKQMTENQLASKNISANIFGIAQNLMGIGGANFANKMWVKHAEDAKFAAHMAKMMGGVTN
jgi:hypothetical protein